MFVILLGLVALVNAAPHFPFHHRHPPHFHHSFRGPHFENELFDTGRFWADLSTELRELDDMLTDFRRHFPSTESQAHIESNEYKIAIPLTGFEEKDIVVKAREGLLMVQAVHVYGEGNQKNYLDIRVLPSYLNVTGNWIYVDNTLRIMFPLKEGAVTVEPVQTEEPSFTKAHSREEVEPAGDNDNADADVEPASGDTNFRGNELETNVIPESGVEATTYAVDLKDEVEFVPVRHR